MPKVRISHMRIPKDQTSDWVVNFLSLRPSGDIHFTGRGFLLFALKLKWEFEYYRQLSSDRKIKQIEEQILAQFNPWFLFSTYRNFNTYGDSVFIKLRDDRIRKCPFNMVYFVALNTLVKWISNNIFVNIVD